MKWLFYGLLAYLILIIATLLGFKQGQVLVNIAGIVVVSLLALVVLFEGFTLFENIENYEE